MNTGFELIDGGSPERPCLPRNRGADLQQTVVNP